jgi:TnpA family transposase
MIFWHVERKSLCIHSQLKSPSSSEVASMIEGVLRHCTDMEVDRHYVDSHGQGTVAFAFCHLLNFQLLPRLKAIGSQRLSRPDMGQADAYPNLQLVLTRPIDWDPIRHHYDEMVKCDGAASRHGRDRIHPTPLHSEQRPAPNLQGPLRAWPRREDDLPLPLSAQRSIAAGDPRGAQRH